MLLFTLIQFNFLWLGLKKKLRFWRLSVLWSKGSMSMIKLPLLILNLNLYCWYSQWITKHTFFCFYLWWIEVFEEHIPLGYILLFVVWFFYCILFASFSCESKEKFFCPFFYQLKLRCFLSTWAKMPFLV